MWSVLNEFQKDKILKLKSSGRSYSEIASVLSISKETIKSFLRRYKLRTEEIYTSCKNCGKELSEGRPKKFCCDICRYKWWRKNTENNRKYLKINVCKNCSKKFKSYDNKVRKYCSHKCYIEDRFKNKARSVCGDQRAV